MAARLTTLGSSATSTEVIERLEHDGGVIVEDFVDAATLAGLWDDLGSSLAEQLWGEGEFVGARTRRLSSLFRRTKHSATLIQQPLFFAAAEHFLRRPVSAWVGDERIDVTPSMQIGLSQAIEIWPGQTGQPLHRDDGLHLRPHPGPQTRVQFMLAMNEFTAANGATLVLPGSHLWDDYRRPLRDQAVPAEMPPGAAVIWLGSTYHAGGANESPGPRTGLSYALDVGNVRQEENQYLAVPMEIVREYPEPIQRLLGYETAPPFCGWYEMNEPMVLVNGDDETLPARDLIGSTQLRQAETRRASSATAQEDHQ